MLFPEWLLGQDNEIKFILDDINGDEVEGLGDGFTVEISPPGDELIGPTTGSKSELGSGFYRYLSPANELVSNGIVGLTISGPGIRQQNLIVTVKSPTPGAQLFPYRMTDVDTGDPLQGVRVEVSTESDKSNLVWVGHTDAFGCAKDANGNDPFLPVGNVYFWRFKAGYLFDNPDSEQVSTS